MNPLRFRAFNQDVGDEGFVFFGLGDPALESTVNYAPIEQYTGIEDKKHKRVWESDIVTLAPFRGAGKGRLALMQRHLWGWKLVAGTDEFAQQITYALPDQFKVVGNIHENPELVKKLEGQNA